MRESTRHGVTIGDDVTVYSEILGEERRLFVHAPSRDEGDEGRHPVLFLLDGDESLFRSAVGLTSYASQREGWLPELIVVAVANTDRGRDMAPTSIVLPDGRERRAGGDAFLAFLRDEVVPWVDAAYATEPVRILSGTSMSGLSTVCASLRDDSPFHAYLASSPILDWDDEFPLRRLRERQAAGLGLSGFLYLFWGENDDQATQSSCRAFAEQAGKHTPDRLLFRAYEGEGHCPYAGFRDGLLALFHGWAPPPNVVRDGAAAVLEHLERPVERLGWRCLPTPALLCGAAEGMIEGGHPEEAARLLGELAGSRKATEGAAFLHAVALMRAGDRNGARSAVATARKRFSDSRTLANLEARLSDR